MNHAVTFVQKDSLMHGLHPLTKAILLMVLSVSLFLITSPVHMLILLVVLFACFILIRINPLHIKSMRITILTAFTIALIQIIFNREGEALLQLGSFDITTGAVYLAVLYGVRFLNILLVSYLFVLTTSPSDLAYSFMQVGVPYRLAFLIVTAMRLVPLFIEEGERIWIAQKMRGASITTKDIKRSALHFQVYLNAVLIAMVKRIDALAISMESRSFGRYKKRTYRNKIIFSWVDGLLLISSVIGLFIYIWHA